VDFARANTLSIRDMCADGMGLCDGLPSFPSVVLPGNPLKHSAPHRLAKRRFPIAAARQESSGLLVAEFPSRLGA
jgi:hypothetical protein